MNIWTTELVVIQNITLTCRYLVYNHKEHIFHTIYLVKLRTTSAFPTRYSSWLLITEWPMGQLIGYTLGINSRVDSRLAPSQSEKSLPSNAVSHWLGANPESALNKLIGHHLADQRLDPVVFTRLKTTTWRCHVLLLPTCWGHVWVLWGALLSSSTKYLNTLHWHIFTDL